MTFYAPIGNTDSSTVFKVLYKDRVVALKRLKANNLQSAEAKQLEYEYGHTLRHPHLVYYEERFIKTNHPSHVAFIVCMALLIFDKQIEYCDGNDLSKYIKQYPKTLTGNKVDGDRFWDFCLDMLLGLEYLHQSNFVHLDFCPRVYLLWLLMTLDNVFLVKDEGRRSKHTLKIGDFGSMVKAGVQVCNTMILSDHPDKRVR